MTVSAALLLLQRDHRQTSAVKQVKGSTFLITNSD